MNDHSTQAWERELRGQLDEALSPPSAPPGMNQRIVAHTRGRLPTPRPVIGRIFGWKMRLAAVVALAVGVGAVAFLNPSRQPAGHGDHAIVASPVSVASISEQLSQLASFDRAPTTSLDRQIDQLQARLASVASNRVWDSSPAEIDAAVAQPLANYPAYPAYPTYPAYPAYPSAPQQNILRF